MTKKLTAAPSAFATKVYELTQRVPRGRVTTYKAIAQKLGTSSYRAVGQALRCNPYSPVVPCHRVVASDGRLNGFNGSRGRKELGRKTKLLTAEGVRITSGVIANFDSVVFRF